MQLWWGEARHQRVPNGAVQKRSGSQRVGASSRASQGVIHEWGEDHDPKDKDRSSGLGNSLGQVNLRQTERGSVFESVE